MQCGDSPISYLAAFVATNDRDIDDNTDAEGGAKSRHSSHSLRLPQA
jgi:hypothetical protein